MKKTKRLLACVAGLALSATAVIGFAGCGDDNSVTVWVSEMEGVKTLTEQQVNAFLDANPNYKDKYKVTVEGIPEGEAATNMVTSVQTGADIFCYAQDQMGRLIEAEALSELGETSAKFVRDNNDAGSVQAATVSGKVYSYPVTSDNGYFMFYDTSVVKAEHLDDLAAIVKDCEDAGKKFSFELEGSAWYTASFFFAAGCTSSWTFNSDTKAWKASDNFGDETKGMIALKGMQILTNSSAYVNSSKAADFGAATPSAVVISGTWDAKTASDNLKTNLGVAKLPSFKLDNKSYQLGSFSGFKLMGVKPQSNTERAEFCHKLAQHLTDKDAQQARLDQFSWGPSNKVAAASETAQSNPALKGLAAQSPFSTPQGQIHGGWWDFAKLLGATKNKSEDDLKGMLKKYNDDLAKYEKMTEEDMEAYGVIGSIASLADTTENLAAGQDKWANWGADLKMIKSEVDGKVVWKSAVKVALAAGDEFQVRQGQAWTVQYGDVGADGFSTKSNFKITADNAGTKYIVLTITKDGDNEKGTVSLSDE